LIGASQRKDYGRAKVERVLTELGEMVVIRYGTSSRGPVSEVVETFDSDDIFGWTHRLVTILALDCAPEAHQRLIRTKGDIPMVG